MEVAYYKGKYWIYEGLKDFYGRVSLVNPLDSSKGIQAEPNKLRLLKGEELKKESKAIEYFRRKIGGK